MSDDRRLIEDLLPIQAISEEAIREKSVRKGHISNLHLWWARRPLVACRAAVYGALVTASQFAPENGPENKKQSLGRANASRFVAELCKYPVGSLQINQAHGHILDRQAERLTAELANGSKTGLLPAWVGEYEWPMNKLEVKRVDIEEGRAPRPRVLDMFAGGGAIPLEVLRLGCEAYAVDLNPVAHIIQVCTLVYPQKYGKPEVEVSGMTGPKVKGGRPTWGGLAHEVRYWSEWVLERVRREIGDLYPPVPDPDYRGKQSEVEFDKESGCWVARGKKDEKRNTLFHHEGADEVPAGHLTPVAYLWTRTVTCKNPHCRATVPLVKQTWLCKKEGRFIALKMIAPKGQKHVRFGVVEARTETNLGFNPAGLSKASSTTCPFCQTAIDSEYVREEGRSKKYGVAPMALAVTGAVRGKRYIEPDDYLGVPDGEDIERRVKALAASLQTTILDEPIPPTGNAGLATGINYLHGMDLFAEMFTPRQLLTLLTFCKVIDSLKEFLHGEDIDEDRANAICAFQTLILGKLASLNNSLTRWKPDAELPVDALGSSDFKWCGILPRQILYQVLEVRGRVK